jgi:AcrR family transcriptional regulator
MNTKPALLPEGRAALVIAHPGHELRVHGWLERARPRVFVLTDGSGGAGEGRIASTSLLLERAGVERGGIYGRFTDRKLYELILDGKHDELSSLVEELASDFEAGGYAYVAGDSVEGYNPSHDLCRVLIGAALETVRARTGRAIPTYDFPLVGRPDRFPPAVCGETVCIELDDPAMERKLAAARGYPELAMEVERAVAAVGAEAFRREYLRPIEYRTGFDATVGVPPYYEAYGAEQVAKGRYQRVLTYRDHFKPMAEALWRHADAAVP